MTLPFLFKYIYYIIGLLSDHIVISILAKVSHILFTTVDLTDIMSGRSTLNKKNYTVAV